MRGSSPKCFPIKRIPSGDKVNIGLISRIDFGRSGFRKGLLDEAFGRFAEEGVNFVVIGGGLISWPSLRNSMREMVRELVKEAKKRADVEEKKFNRTRAREEAEDLVVDMWADELAHVIPRLKHGRKLVKIYVVVSPSSNYDGSIGIKVARRLARKRRDIRVWGEGTADFPLQQVGGSIEVIVPTKAVWRSKYFSTMVDRLVEDELRRRAKQLPMMFVVGCSASSIMRPEGESVRSIVSIPALHVLENVNSAENAIGCRIIKISGDKFTVTTYSFKDLVRDERKNVSCRYFKKGTDERGVFSAIKSAPMTIGMLADRLGISRKRIQKAIANINKISDSVDGKVPRIVLNSDSGIYDFDNFWMQRHLKYKKPSIKKKVSQVVFGCMHAGSVYTDYRFIRDELPEIVDEWGCEVLVGAGDLIEGIEHDLILRGEVFGGINITDQERIAGKAVANAICYVFRRRFGEIMASSRKKNFSQDEIREMIDRSLLTFVYTVGNHDAWVERDGIRPLEKFRSVLIGSIVDFVEKTISEHGLFVFNLRDLVKKKVVLVSQNTGTIEINGIKMSVVHPRMSRTRTSSIRAQESLAKFRGSQIVDIANFHVAIIVEQWEEDVGNRIAIQVGTLVKMTGFENGKLKIVDFGVVCSDVYFDVRGRIVKTDLMFAGKPSIDEPLDNRRVAERVIDFIKGEANSISC